MFKIYGRNDQCEYFIDRKDNTIIITQINYGTINNYNNYVLCPEKEEGPEEEIEELFRLEEFDIFKDPKLSELMYASMHITEQRLAQVLHYLCKETVNYSERSGWYYYTGERWKLSEIRVRNMIYTELAEKYGIVIDNLKQQRNNEKEK